MSCRPLVQALEATGRRVVGFDSTGSTNTEAMRLAADGAAHGTLVVADAQTAGRGRVGRSWYSPAGHHVYLSVIWRFDWPAARAPLVTLQAAVAVASAIEAVCGVRPGLKWPNDVLFSDEQGAFRKCAGILTELRAAGDSVDAIVVGVGVDVGPMDEAPDDIRAIATSLSEVASKPVDRTVLLTRLADELDRAAAACRTSGTFDRAAWMRFDATLGRSVRVEAPGDAAWTGVAVDLDPMGMLIVERDGGTRDTVTAGDVIFLPDA